MKRTAASLAVLFAVGLILWMSGNLTVKMGTDPGVWLNLPCQTTVSVHRISGFYTAFCIWAGPRTSPYYPGACDFAIGLDDNDIKCRRPQCRLQFRRKDGGLSFRDLP